MGRVPVAHDDGASNGHAGRPAAEDDLVLVADAPVLELVLGREVLPAGLGGLLLALEEGLAGAGPGGLVELDAAALGLDGVRGADDEDHAERLEVRREGAVGGRVAVGIEGGGEGDGEAGGDALDRTAQGGSLVAGELFFGDKLEQKVSIPSPRSSGGQ